MNEYRRKVCQELYTAVNVINDWIVEGFDLSTLPAQLTEFGYSEKDIIRIKISLINLKEALKDKEEPTIKPNKPQTRSWFNPNMSSSLPTPYSWNPNIKQDSLVEICRSSNYDDDISSAPYSGPMPLDGGLKD
jgi:hypothetical protein